MAADLFCFHQSFFVGLLIADFLAIGSVDCWDQDNSVAKQLIDEYWELIPSTLRDTIEANRQAGRQVLDIKKREERQVVEKFHNWTPRPDDWQDQYIFAMVQVAERKKKQLETIHKQFELQLLEFQQELARKEDLQYATQRFSEYPVRVMEA